MDSYFQLNSEFKSKIEQEILMPNIKDDIENLTIWRTRWRLIGNSAETFAKLTSGAATICAFAAGFFDNKIISFIAGTCGTVSLVLLHYAKYAQGESKERNAQLNVYLKTLDIHEIAELPVHEDESK